MLDGDIDPMWIESLNTVMDDNKILTLASNERIPLLPEMKLVFEIANLRYATPATVSRAGILYINSGPPSLCRANGQGTLVGIPSSQAGWRVGRAPTRRPS